jgi:hypothetical protein
VGVEWAQQGWNDSTMAPVPKGRASLFIHSASLADADIKRDARASMTPKWVIVRPPRGIANPLPSIAAVVGPPNMLSEVGDSSGQIQSHPAEGRSEK